MMIRRGIRPVLMVSPLIHIEKGMRSKAFTRHVVQSMSSMKKSDAVVRNDSIPSQTVRLILEEVQENGQKWQIISKAEAIAIAKENSTDLVAVNLKADPPVCKLLDYSKVVKEAKKKAKAQAANQKSHKMKEIFLKTGIDKHNLDIKTKQLIGFLEDGNPVKVVIITKRQKWFKKYEEKVNTWTGASSFDEMVVTVLEAIQHLPVSVQEQQQKLQETNEEEDDSDSDDEEEEEVKVRDTKKKYVPRPRQILPRKEFILTPRVKEMKEKLEKMKLEKK